MKRKKSTQLLAVALTAAMLAQPVGAQMVFAEGNADVVQQEQAVSPAAETTGAVLKSGTAVIPANADLNQVKAILGKTLVENADQVNLSSLEWDTHFSSENSHRETLHRGRMFRSPWAFGILC